MPNRIGVGVVGAGGTNIATSAHLPAMELVPEVEVIALCDVNEDGVREYAERFGTDAYTDYAAMLEREDIDMVQVCTPDQLHAEHTIQAAEAGKHVLCQKPMALSMDEAHAMRNAVARAGVKFQCCQNMRWMPRSLRLKQLIDGGAIGDPVYGRYSTKGRFFPYPEDSFYRKKGSGGQFVHNGMHIVDLLSWLMNALPSQVYGMTTQHYPTDDRLDTDNYTTSQMRFDNGALGAVEQNLMMLDPPGFPPQEELVIIGTGGTISAGDSDNVGGELFSDGALSFTRGSTQGSAGAFAQMIQDFANCITDDRTPTIPIEHSIRVLEACLATLESADTGQPKVVGS